MLYKVADLSMSIFSDPECTMESGCDDLSTCKDGVCICQLGTERAFGSGECEWVTRVACLQCDLCSHDSECPSHSTCNKGGSSITAYYFFCSGCWPSYSMSLLNLKLVGTVGVRNYMRSSYSQWALNFTFRATFRLTL